MELLLDNEMPLRLGTFLGLFLAIALWESLAPRRGWRYPRLRRWPANFAIAALGALLLRLVVPAAAVGAAVWAEARGWGLMNQGWLPALPAIIVSVMLLDLLIWAQHLTFHKVPLFWRLHRMHHSDPDFDVSTGVRFHPGEILLSMGIKIAGVIALGAPAVGVLIFELLLNATSVFNHGNIRLPERVDRLLRWVVVTPDMHRVHHSVVRDETDSNFGFSIPWWDRLFGTYRDQPAAGHAGMRIGLDEFGTDRELGLGRMLVQPFVSVPARPDAGGQLES